MKYRRFLKGIYLGFYTHSANVLYFYYFKLF